MVEKLRAVLRFPAHKCGLYLTHNTHKDAYETVAEWAADREVRGYSADWVSDEQRDLAFASDEVWELQWYPDTPIGSYSLCAADLDVLLAAACE